MLAEKAGGVANLVRMALAARVRSPAGAGSADGGTAAAGAAPAGPSFCCTMQLQSMDGGNWEMRVSMMVHPR